MSSSYFEIDLEVIGDEIKTLARTELSLVVLALIFSLWKIGWKESLVFFVTWVIMGLNSRRWVDHAIFGVGAEIISQDDAFDTYGDFIDDLNM